MRATADTVAHLDIAIKELIATKGEDKVTAYRHQVTYVKCQFTSFVWGLFYALNRADRKAIIANQGNPLKDSHIETALKKVLHDYNT